LDVDTRRIHVGDAAAAAVVDVEPGHALRELDAVEPLQLCCRKMLFQSEQEQVFIFACSGAAGQRGCRCRGDTENCSTT